MPVVKQKLQVVFQNEELARQFVSLDPRTRAMVWESAYLANRFGYRVVVTSIHRPDGIHSTWGACDLDFVQTEPNPPSDYHDFGPLTARYLNKTYKYGRGWLGRTKPAALWHGGDSPDLTAGWHLHLQSPAGRDMKLVN